MQKLDEIKKIIAGEITKEEASKTLEITTRQINDKYKLSQKK